MEKLITVIAFLTTMLSWGCWSASCSFLHNSAIDYERNVNLPQPLCSDADFTLLLALILTLFVLFWHWLTWLFFLLWSWLCSSWSDVTLTWVFFLLRSWLCSSRSDIDLAHLLALIPTLLILIRLWLGSSSCCDPVLVHLWLWLRSSSCSNPDFVVLLSYWLLSSSCSNPDFVYLSLWHDWLGSSSCSRCDFVHLALTLTQLFLLICWLCSSQFDIGLARLLAQILTLFILLWLWLDLSSCSNPDFVHLALTLTRLFFLLWSWLFILLWLWLGSSSCLDPDFVHLTVWLGLSFRSNPDFVCSDIDSEFLLASDPDFVRLALTLTWLVFVLGTWLCLSCPDFDVAQLLARILTLFVMFRHWLSSSSSENDSAALRLTLMLHSFERSNVWLFQGDDRSDWAHAVWSRPHAGGAQLWPVQPGPKHSSRGRSHTADTPLPCWQAVVFCGHVLENQAAVPCTMWVEPRISWAALKAKRSSLHLPLSSIGGPYAVGVWLIDWWSLI